MADNVLEQSPQDNQGPSDVALYASLSISAIVSFLLKEPNITESYTMPVSNALKEISQDLLWYYNCKCFLTQELPTRQESVSVLMQDKNLDQELKAGTVSIFETVMFIVYAMKTAPRRST